jgi:hypothetical protein
MRLLKRWLPWKFFLKRAARAYGIIDPLGFLARMRQFSQPSEVQEPIELLRAGIAFHARGLINTKAIQHNLDWIWPYWVERQFNPGCASFIPRAFSFSHVNLTHRNWTAAGHPDLPLYPIVDPRGLVTPHFDGWSIDFWAMTESGERLFPSRAESAEQTWTLDPNPMVTTRLAAGDLRLESRVDVQIRDDGAWLRIRAEAASAEPGWLAAAFRPYNPEGIQFIERISASRDGRTLEINDRERVEMSEAPARALFSTYDSGDVVHRIGKEAGGGEADCRVGMATAAMLFPVAADRNGRVELGVPLAEGPDISETSRKIAVGKGPNPPLRSSETAWSETLAGAARLRVPDARYRFLYDAALHTLILLTAEDAVPGPYTYRRFWFRDACLMIHALLGVHLTDRAERILDGFPPRQKWSGYFHSQAGEWDSNGEALWIMHRFCQLNGNEPKQAWHRAIHRGARWITRKRLPAQPASPHAGLLPSGFSAEHLGPNDFYYWDDFWGVAGLQAAAGLSRMLGEETDAQDYMQSARSLSQAIDRSLEAVAARMGGPVIPASPYRRLDSGAIGSIVADYPLQLWAPKDPRIMATAEFLLSRCLIKGAFYQDMVHSGINAYLSLHLAQLLLRARDRRWHGLVSAVAELASSTGQWPEAIHPHTGGGCMGDGQHVWAAAEWIMMLRNCFVREEGDRLVLASGIPPEWSAAGEPMEFGPTPTPLGTVSVRFVLDGDRLSVRIDRSPAAGRPANRSRHRGRSRFPPGGSRRRRTIGNAGNRKGKSMNICMFTNTYLPHVGGVARSVHFFAEDLRRMGHRVMIVAPTFPESEGPEIDETEVLRVPAIQNFNGSDFSVRIAQPFLIDEAIDEMAPDTIHSHHPFLLGDAAMRAAHRRKLPLVFTHHTLDTSTTPTTSPAGSPRRMRRFAIRAGHRATPTCATRIVRAQREPSARTAGWSAA